MLPCVLSEAIYCIHIYTYIRAINYITYTNFFSQNHYLFLCWEKSPVLNLISLAFLKQEVKTKILGVYKENLFQQTCPLQMCMRELLIKLVLSFILLDIVFVTLFKVFGKHYISVFSHCLHTSLYKKVYFIDIKLMTFYISFLNNKLKI